jgi:hypothetical protein
VSMAWVGPFGPALPRKHAGAPFPGTGPDHGMRSAPLPGANRGGAERDPSSYACVSASAMPAAHASIAAKSR